MSADLKQLQTRKTKLDAEIARIEEEGRAVTKALNDARGRRGAVMADIERATSQPVVSEHAMLRYMERVMGLDLGCVRSEILTDDMQALIRAAGSGKYPLGNHRLVVKGMTVVTIE